MKSFENKPRTYCINIGIKDTLEMCEKEKINSTCKRVPSLTFINKRNKNNE